MQISLVGEPDTEYTTIRAKPKKCVCFNEAVAIKHFYEIDVVSPNLKSSVLLRIFDPSDGAYEPVFGPMHPNGTLRRRRSAVAACEYPASLMPQSDAGAAIYEMNQAVCQFNSIKYTVNVPKTVTSHTIDTDISVTGFRNDWEYWMYNGERNLAANQLPINIIWFPQVISGLLPLLSSYLSSLVCAGLRYCYLDQIMMSELFPRDFEYFLDYLEWRIGRHHL